jgi:membrane-associated protease RseP (regulator of RpoE activity)
MTRSHDTTLVSLLAALALALLSLTSGCAQAPALDDGVSKASQLFQQGDHDGVIALLQPMAERDPNLSTTSLDLLGMAYYHQHQYRQAAAILERATAPGMFSGMPFAGRRINLRNHGVLGWCYFHMKEPARARAAFDKALAKSDFSREPAWDENALRGRAWTRYFQGDFQGTAADVSAAQRLAKTHPDIDNAAHSYSRHLVMAYASLGLQKDKDADTMAHGAVAAAKQTKIPPQIARRDVAPIYLMLGRRDQAYALFGSKSTLGIQMQDNPQGASKGVRVVQALVDSPAQQAGVMAGDIIVAVDGQPVANAPELARQIGSRSAGQKAQLSLLRNGSPMQLATTLAAPDTVIAQHELLQPLLKVLQLPAAASVDTVTPSPSMSPPDQMAIPPEPVPVGTRTVVVDMPPPAAASPVPQMETPVRPELRIKSAKVEPDPVPAGESFRVNMEVFVLDQDMRTETVGVALRYTISKDGKEMARFAPGTFQVPNGVPSPLSYTTRASKTPGDYMINTELELGSLKTHVKVKLNIR